MTKHKSVPAASATRTSRRLTVAGAEGATPISRRYIESSALVAALIEDDTAAEASIRAPGMCITSALTLAETGRALLRARLSGRITAQQERAAMLVLQRFTSRCYVVNITEAILANAARPFPVEPIRTLDAIHLATVDALGYPPAFVTMVTRDARVRDNASASGYIVE